MYTYAGKKYPEWKKIIYVHLLNEGSVTYRPISAYLIENNIFKIDGSNCCNPETWESEFLSDTDVFVEIRKLGGKHVLVAKKEIWIERNL